MSEEPTELDYLKRISRDIKAVRELMTQFVNAQIEAEAEVPEKVRRFMTYYHDLHDIKYMYEELGQTPYGYILKELMRCDDRYRHLLEDQFTDTGAFEKVRQDMTKRDDNRWDHQRLLQKGTNSETGNGS